MKKLNKFFAVLVALAMMATLCVSMAFAESQDTYGGNDKTITGEDVGKKDSADALLVKFLQLADGVTKPTDTFHFTFTGKASDTITAAEANAILEDDISIATSEMTAETVFATDGKTVAKAIPVKDQINLSKVTKPGVYIYEVTEQETGTATKNEGTMAYNINNETYVVRMYIIQNDDKTYTVKNITVTDKNGDKEDATNDPTSTTDEDVTSTRDFRTEGLSFVNNYTKVKEEGSDPAKNGALKLTKNVVGEFAKKDQQFPFTITLTRPFNDSTTEINYKKNGTAQTLATFNAQGVATIDVTLADDEYVTFDALPAGTTYSIVENLDKQEAGAYVVANHDKYTNAWALYDVGNEETALAASEGIVKDTDTKNDATCTNTFADSSTTPTGILISNLPYIALALVAIGGLVAYVVVRRRQDDEA